MWLKYRGAIIPNLPPHLQNLTNNDAKKGIREHSAIFARYISNWDCNYPTEWWYCIRDSKICLADLNTKQRYRINRGLKNCEIFLVEDIDNQLFKEFTDVAKESFTTYPVKYRPTIVVETYINGLKSQFKHGDLWGVRDIETGIISGYAWCKINNNTVNMVTVKTRPSFQKKEINAALAYKICEYYLNYRNLLYVSDGERNISHESNYQDFLVKNLGFRYAYCNLNIVYNPIVKIIINLLYPFRNLFKIVGNNKMMYTIYTVLYQEQILRSFRDK